jgi:N-acetylmuramoyl-L-alanine amidase
MRFFRCKLFGLIALIGLGISGAAEAGFRTVVVDAGHGGHDRGGVPGQKISEKAMALDVAKRVRGRLAAAGLNPILTRSGDCFVSLGGRVAMANARPGCVFVSIHFNSARRVGAAGIETFYYGAKSLGLATSIHKRVLAVAKSENRGVRSRGFYVLRRSRVPAVLVECGFLTNPAEGRRILNASHRESLAKAIADGIIARSRL